MIKINCYWKPALLMVFVLFATLSTSAQDDKNVSISQQKERYEFIKISRGKVPVGVRVNSETVFKCNSYRTELPFAEFYDDNTTIDELKIYTNGSRDKSIQVHNEYYSVDDVFYSDARVCYFSLPLEKQGSTSSVQLEKTINDPRYLTSIYFPEPYKMDSKEIEIVVPEWMEVEIVELHFENNKISKQVSTEKGKTVYRYTARNMPEQKKVANGPGPSYIYPHLLVLAKSAQIDGGTVQFFKTLQHQYDWYRSLVKQIGNDNTTVKPIAEEVAKQAKNDVDKIKEVFKWVQEHIRYIAFEDGIAGFKPEKAQEVLRRKYGDCKGMANLMKEMLVSLGFDARLCWLGTNSIFYDYSRPSLSTDNHMICAVKLNNKFVFLDGTEKYIGFNEYAERIAGRQVLIEDGDKYILDRIPTADAKQNKRKITTKFSLTNNVLTGTVEQALKGEKKEQFLSYLNSVKKESVQQTMARILSHDNRNYTVSDVVTTNENDWNNDLLFKYKVDVKDAVTSFDSETYLNLEFLNDYFDMMIDSTRKVDYWFGCKEDFECTVEIQLPAGVKASDLPTPVDVSTDNYKMNVGYTMQPGKLLLTKKIIVSNPRLPAASISQWNKHLKQLKTFYQHQLTLKKS